jgi:hypothetical protein
MMPTADARKESRLSIPTHMRQAMWAMPAADAERDDRKADMALRAAEASQRRGFQHGAESAHRRALAFCESLPMALRVADSAEAYGFTHLAVDGLSLAVSLSQTMPDVRFVLNLAQQRRYADVVALACSRLVAVAQKADEAVSAAETAYALGHLDIARSALEQALTFVILPHERRQVERCALHLGLADAAGVAETVA